MILGNLRLNNYPNLCDISIDKGTIRSITSADKSFALDKDGSCIRFDQAIAFPGLINSHDHLDFNLFPKLGNKIYKNYREWGLDIQKENKNVIHSILKIPQDVRTQWGIYKNLLNGITTIINHGEKLRTGKELITVVQDYKALHSVGFEKNWIFKLNQPINNPGPFVIHIGEGTDEYSHREIDRLITYNLFKKELIGVHGVAMDEKQATKFRGLVWCPSSNFFLLGKTARIDQLQHQTKIGFGTDSSLTADWNFWNQIRVARKIGMVTDSRLHAMLTTEAASVWGLRTVGSTAMDQQADLVIAENKDSSTWFDTFYSLNPENILMVIHKGFIRMFDEKMLIQLKTFGLSTRDFSKILINKRVKYIQGDLPGLINKIKEFNEQFNYPDGVSLI